MYSSQKYHHHNQYMEQTKKRLENKNFVLYIVRSLNHVFLHDIITLQIQIPVGQLNHLTSNLKQFVWIILSYFKLYLSLFLLIQMYHLLFVQFFWLSTLQQAFANMKWVDLSRLTQNMMTIDFKMKKKFDFTNFKYKSKEIESGKKI